VAPGLLRCARNDGGVDAAIIGHRLIHVSWARLLSSPNFDPGNFACEAVYFACETILFRLDPRKLLKSLEHEMLDFAVLCDFRGLWPVLFRRFLPFVFRSTRRVQKLAYCFPELVDSTNSVCDEAKRRVPGDAA
jgi:hypothetical protein